MWKLITATLLLAAGGCGQRGGDGQNQTQANDLPTAHTPPANKAPVSEPAIRAMYRTTSIATCVEGRRRRAGRNEGSNPAGTDFRPYCTCFIDRVMSSLTTDQLEGTAFGAREQPIAARCARENGLLPDTSFIEEAGGMPDF